ncbi:hypothetical protein GTQ34_03230 [Muricauda sp. JGD-17]|uniref:Lipid/polyisoprenoid-binding YceI-like domain-containing protein n=1 Tax=Flagellimonas ochracea TaxID=2696472 RepID=A0A964TB62_9FLAO|nr:YceI family protein [Allomuricauda ochracea]NAY90921.1 hypothetical protein [Allomuricauda ochracea]
MKNHFILFFVLLPTFWISAQNVTITTAKITFEFPSKNVKGTIGGFESTSKIDWENPSNSVFQGSVESATLDTNNGLRNWSLRSSRYFSTKTYPRISFTSKEVRKKGNTWVVLGDLTLKGIKKPFRIDFEQTNGKLKGRGELYSSDFNIKIKKQREDNLVLVYFELEIAK